MKLLVQIMALGFEPTPWTVPSIARRGGQYRTKKSRLAEGRPNLADWQLYVASAARVAMGGRGPVSGPIRIRMVFRARTPPGHKHWALWFTPLKPHVTEEGVFTKGTRNGRQEADLTNLFKGTEDALQGIVFADDVQTRGIEALCTFGRHDGVEIEVYEYEPGDFPGIGEPVPCEEAPKHKRTRSSTSSDAAAPRSPRKKRSTPVPTSES